MSQDTYNSRAKGLSEIRKSLTVAGFLKHRSEDCPTIFHAINAYESATTKIDDEIDLLNEDDESQESQ